jgi:hypothetical protein
MRVDSLVVLARNVRAALDDRFGERPQEALDELDDLVRHAATLRPAIEARAAALEYRPQTLFEEA